MEARHGCVGPRAMAWLPGRDNPALAVLGTARHIWTGENLVVVGLLRESLSALEHHAILHAQVGEGFFSAVLQPKLHANGVGGRSDFCAERDAVRQCAFAVKR